MAVRATDEDVRAYVSLGSSISTTPYISAANALVEANLASSGLSSTILTQIEIFLAAHFAVLSTERGGLRRDAFGDSSQSYQTISEKFTGLNTTRYGQQAIVLDTTGTLAAIGVTKPKAQFRVVGSATVDDAS